MKRFILSLILLASSLYCCRAQDMRLWIDGPVSDWSGFQIAPADDSLSFFASYTLSKKRQRVRTTDAVYRYMDFSGAILPYMSRVKQEAMNASELAALQREFDILEYFARQYRDDLLFSTDTRSLKENDYIARFREACKEACRTGDYSRYSLSRGQFDVSAISYETGARFTGITAGIFTDMPIGDQGRLLYPTAGLTLGIDRGRDRGSFDAQAQVGVSAYRKDYMDLRQSFVLYSSVFGLYRREIATVGPAKLSVHAGPGFAGRLFEAAGEYILVGGPSLREGLATDIYAGRTVVFSTGRPEQSDRFWRVILSLDQLYNLRTHKLFPAVNLAVGLWFQTRSITRRQP